ADVGADWSVQGAGRVDVARAVRQDLTGPAAADLGRLEPDGGTVTRPLRYTNGGPAAVTLTLALTLDGWNGRAAPTGLGRLSATTLTVPAGGSASVDLALDPSAG